MTERGRTEACRWCGRPLPDRRTGRPRQYCKQGCRQRAYEARRLAAAHGLGAGALVLRAEDLQALRDRIYELETALADAADDLVAAGPRPRPADVAAVTASLRRVVRA